MKKLIDLSGVCFKYDNTLGIRYCKVINQCGNVLYTISFHIDKFNSDEFWFSFSIHDDFEDDQIISEEEFLEKLEPYKKQIIKIFNELGI